MDQINVLIIEDSLDSQFLLKHALQRKGFRAELCGTSQEAMAYLESHDPPQLILLDFSTPGMQAPEFMEKLRALPEGNKIKVVLVSGWDDLATKAKAIGADASIRKPFQLQSLYGTIDQVLTIQ